MTRKVLAAALAAASVLGLAACSDEENADVTDDTVAVESEAPVQSGGPEIDEAILAEVTDRGKPTVEAVEGEVTELQITDDVEGTGTEVQAGDTVTAHYVGVAGTTGEQFDSSWESGEPLTFPLDQVIQGWSEGLVGMKEGGRRTLVIPADLAYGESGPAPGDALVFTVDLVAVS